MMMNSRKKQTSLFYGFLLILLLGSNDIALARKDPSIRRSQAHWSPSTPSSSRRSPVHAFLRLHGGSQVNDLPVAEVTEKEPLPVVKTAEEEAKEYKQALIKTGLTVAAAGCFGVFLRLTRGATTAYEFLAGYLIEQSLSIDNLFVFLMLFDAFRVPSHLQNRVLSWGIGGAVVLRGLMIGMGVAALQKFKSVILVFAGILLASSLKLLLEKEDHDADPQDNFVMKITSKLFPNTSKDFDGEKFFTLQQGKRVATPLFLCLICVELSDFVFAVDSIPAVLGVSKDPFVVYASNIFAILALRSLYTVVAKAVSQWHYLKPAVALVLAFVGSKMIVEYFHLFPITTEQSLLVICTLLGGGVGLSLWEQAYFKKKEEVEILVTVHPNHAPNMSNYTHSLANTTTTATYVSS